MIEFVGSTPRMLRFGAVTHPHSATTGARLHAIHEMIAGLVAEFTPDAVAVEDVFSKINVGTALKLAEVRGVVLLAAAQASIPAHSYSPREVKSSVAGYGDASKLQMQQMVRSALGLCEFPEPADAADALAVALCHAHAARAAQRGRVDDIELKRSAQPSIARDNATFGGGKLSPATAFAPLASRN